MLSGICRCALTQLPCDLLERLIGELDVKAARQLASTCRLLYALSSEAVPGLRLSLNPYQVRPLILACISHSGLNRHQVGFY